VEVRGTGLLEAFRFGTGDSIARKSMVDPDMAAISWIHDFRPPENGVPFSINSSYAHNFVSGIGMKKSLNLMTSELNSITTLSYQRPMLVGSLKRTETLS
jgi:hypothetical protein